MLNRHLILIILQHAYNLDRLIYFELTYLLDVILILVRRRTVVCSIIDRVLMCRDMLNLMLFLL